MLWIYWDLCTVLPVETGKMAGNCQGLGLEAVGVNAKSTLEELWCYRSQLCSLRILYEGQLRSSAIIVWGRVISWPAFLLFLSNILNRTVLAASHMGKVVLFI